MGEDNPPKLMGERWKNSTQVNCLDYCCGDFMISDASCGGHRRRYDFSRQV